MKAKIIINCLLALFGLVNPVFGQQLSPAQQMADFDTLCAKLEYVHPDLYPYQSREEYENNKTKIKSSMTDSIRSPSISPSVARIPNLMKLITMPCAALKDLYQS